jgi:hypothetical protein
MTDHPYRRFEETTLWKTVDRAIGELVENQDLGEKALRYYIVGYLIQELVNAGLVGMNNPDDVCEQHYGTYMNLSMRPLDGETILLEGNSHSLEFLAKLILAQTGFEEDCGFQISPTGAGSSFFAAGSKGIYIHRTDQDGCELQSHEEPNEA